MITTDVVIIGAGPCGLFQVFELGLLGLKSEVVDSIRHPGGQCIELYPDKPIYDIPAVPICTGQELTDLLLLQIRPFNCGMHLGEEMQIVRRRDDDSFILETAAGTRFNAKAVVIAGGVGSFQPRRLRVRGAGLFEGNTLRYRVADPNVYSGKRLVILGGGDSALDWTLALLEKAQHVTLVHRRDAYRAAPDSVSKMRRLVDAGKMDLFEDSRVTEICGSEGEISSVVVSGYDGDTSEVVADHVLVFFGLAAKLGPIADWGLDINRKTINVDAATFESSEPGIFAIGDISEYPGKKKLILSGFYEAAHAAFAIKQRLNPDKKVSVLYTTTSTVLQKRLGVTGRKE